MSIDAYHIAVRISLVENVTRGLALMSRHFASANADAAALEARMKSIGKMAASGAILVGAGLGGLAILKGPLEEAKKYQVLQERFRQFGMGDAAMRDAERFVESRKIMGSSQRDMLRYFVEAQGVFRESGANNVSEQLAAAKMAAPMLARINFATRGLDEHAKEIMESKQMDMLRFIEQAGGLKSPQRFNELLNSGFKAVQSSGGNVDFTQYRQFMARGGSSAMGLTSRALFADLEPLIGEMKGNTAGTALMTAFNRMNGIVKLPNQVAHELVKNGLWDGSKIVWNSQGGIKQFNGDPLRNAGLLSSSPVDFYRTMVQPMYARLGLDPAQRIIENSKIFGRTGGAFFNLMERQMPTIMRSREAFNRSRGINSTYNSVGKTAAGMEVDLTAREADLKLKIGQIILPYYVKGLEMALGVLTRINAFVSANPTFTKIAVGALALVSIASIVGGSLLLITAGIRGLMLIGSLVPILRAVGTGLSILRGGLMFLPNLFRMLLVGMGPIGWAILGIGAAALLVWNNWREIRGALGLIWNDIRTGVAQLFSGDIMGALKTFSIACARGFQTLFNTIIAGLNAINPFGQIGKLTFADQLAANGSSPNIRAGSGQPIHVHTAVNMDGRKVADVVTYHQVKGTSRPNAGSLSPDWNRAPAYHGMLTSR
jgi:hypothetical protein